MGAEHFDCAHEAVLLCRLCAVCDLPVPAGFCHSSKAGKPLAHRLSNIRSAVMHLGTWHVQQSGFVYNPADSVVDSLVNVWTLVVHFLAAKRHKRTTATNIVAPTCPVLWRRNVLVCSLLADDGRADAASRAELQERARPHGAAQHLLEQRLRLGHVAGHGKMATLQAETPR